MNDTGSGTGRVDKWLVAVRVFKTRRQATDACTLGRVRVNGATVKPATRLAIGDVVETRRRDRVVTYEVVEVIDKRVSPPRAAECVIDRSPPEPTFGGGPERVAARERGAGRPTKRDRRRLDSFRTLGTEPGDGWDEQQ